MNNQSLNNIRMYDPDSYYIASKRLEELPYNLPKEPTFEYYLMKMKARLEINEIQIPILTELRNEIPGDIEFIKKINGDENYRELRKYIMEKVVSRKYNPTLIASVIKIASPELIESLKNTLSSDFYIYNCMSVMNTMLIFLPCIKSQTHLAQFISQFKEELNSIESSEISVEKISENVNEEIDDISEDKNIKKFNYFAEINWKKLSTQAATLAISSICFKCGCTYILPFMIPFLNSFINNTKNNAIEESISNITEDIVTNNNLSNNTEKKSNIWDLVSFTAKTIIKYFNRSE